MSETLRKISQPCKEKVLNDKDLLLYITCKVTLFTNMTYLFYGYRLFLYIYDTVTRYVEKSRIYTFNPISSAKGRTNKSPTVDTDAFPASNDFAV